MILDILQEAGVFWQHEIDCCSLSSESTGSTDSVNVVLLLDWQLVVDDEANLLNIDTSSKQVGGDEYSHSTLSELLHDDISLDLVHFSVHD